MSTHDLMMVQVSGKREPGRVGVSGGLWVKGGSCEERYKNKEMELKLVFVLTLGDSFVQRDVLKDPLYG